MSSSFGTVVARQMSSARFISLRAPGGRELLAKKKPSLQALRPAAITTSALFEGDSRRLNIYTDYTVYKSKGAMGVKVIRPTWERVPTGSGLKIAREGTLLLEFAHAKGEREYDWEGKGMFALSAVECADVLVAVETGSEKSFFHDPYKMGNEEGTVTKTLRVTPAQNSGYFFSLSVRNKAGVDARFDTPVSPAELRVIRKIMDFSIPKLLGFDEMFTGAPDVRESSDQMGVPMAAPPF